MLRLLRRASLDQRWSCLPLTFSCMDPLRLIGYVFIFRIIIWIGNHMLIFTVNSLHRDWLAFGLIIDFFNEFSDEFSADFTNESESRSTTMLGRFIDFRVPGGNRVQHVGSMLYHSMAYWSSATSSVKTTTYASSSIKSTERDSWRG